MTTAAQPEREPKIQPDGVADDLGGEPVTGIAGARANVPLPPVLCGSGRSRSREKSSFDHGRDCGWSKGLHDSALEGTGFEPSVPREASALSAPVRADFSGGGKSSGGNMSRSRNP
jgi:hypothetical protein